ncbi:MAG: DNA polymerase III subunit beta [Patescibacteria group bacterium]|jgi:DNA polymerase-3 subunit beta
MKFSCLQENLSQGLNTVSHLAGINKSGLPILNNILISTEKGGLKLSSTNLEIAIETIIRAKIEEEGTFTVPSQIFNNYINLLPLGEVLNLEIKDNELIIEAKNQTAKIKGSSSEEFPIIPQIEKKEKIIIESKILKDALEKIIFTISPNEIRMEISGVLFTLNYPKDKNLTIVGTDSYRLAEKSIVLKELSVKEIKNIIIPAKTLQELLKIIKNEDNVEIYLLENQILFIYQNTELVSRLISGIYPDYKQIIPQNFKTKTLLNKDDFLKTVKAASFFTKSGINDIFLKLIAKKNQVQISSLNNQVGENKAVLEGEISGEDNEIVFNYRYLLDGLINLGGEEVNIEVTNDNTAAVIRSVSDESYLYLIMPIKSK